MRRQRIVQHQRAPADFRRTTDSYIQPTGWFRVSGSVSCFLASGIESPTSTPKPETRNQKPETYSYLSATIGSTFAARRAGTKQAPRATPASRTEMPMKVIGSVALKPYN